MIRGDLLMDKKISSLVQDVLEMSEGGEVRDISAEPRSFDQIEDELHACEPASFQALPRTAAQILELGHIIAA